ncbi:MAG TPA: hypothetical protein VLK36_15335 [Gaiellaceae bacterium]|nr:hypothetical protein [Gaiellaceae bacterium]
MGRLALSGLTGVAALVAAQAAAAVSPPVIVAPLSGSAGDAVNFQSPDHAASVQLSSVKAGADDVALTVRLQSVLRCGQPTGGAVVVSLPKAAHVPGSIARTSVRVNGKAPSKVSVAATTVTVSLPVVHGITCDSMTDGVVQVAFAASAALGNPAHAGTYAVGVRQAKAAHSVSIAIKQ